MLPLAKAAAAWSSTVRVAVVVCERLEEFGSLPVKEIVVTPRVVEVAETVQDLACTRGEAAGAGRYRPQRGAAAEHGRGQGVVQVVSGTGRIAHGHAERGRAAADDRGAGAAAQGDGCRCDVQGEDRAVQPCCKHRRDRSSHTGCCR